ncbi:MAG TPA: DUF1844 domain-containing protein [Candidatus Binatia bacterium]|nr:DUF1844 domain-containing protein [Candidatus Binatia bacterium]
MTEDDKEERRGFQVKDRRRFSETGEAKPDAPETTAATPAPDLPPPPSPHPEPAYEPVNFSTFVLGLSTQALLHLGEIPDPTTGQTAPDLGAAKHVIDILGILRDKTRGNLEPGEENLLDSVLYDLRMRYVELVRRGSKEGT